MGDTCSSSLMIAEAPGLFGLPNPCATRDSISLMISEVLGSLGWGIHASPAKEFVNDF